jgi:hypothetical protein
MTDPISPALARILAKRAAAEKLIADTIEQERRLRELGDNRRLATRRKIIIGSELFTLAGADKAAAAMLERIKGGLRRRQDRAAFGLPPLPDQADSADAPSAGVP